MIAAYVLDLNSPPMSDTRYQRLDPALLPQAHRFYKSQRSSMRVGRAEQVWVARQTEIVAACCLTSIEQGHWLTALLVASSQRRRGIASRLLEHLRSVTTGPIWLFCAPELLGFYQRQGFLPCAQLPAALAQRFLRYQRQQNLLALVCAQTGTNA